MFFLFPVSVSYGSAVGLREQRQRFSTGASSRLLTRGWNVVRISSVTEGDLEGPRLVENRWALVLRSPFLSDVCVASLRSVCAGCTGSLPWHGMKWGSPKSAILDLSFSKIRQRRHLTPTTTTTVISNLNSSLTCYFRKPLRTVQNPQTNDTKVFYSVPSPD